MSASLKLQDREALKLLCILKYDFFVDCKRFTSNWGGQSIVVAEKYETKKSFVRACARVCVYEYACVL